MDYPQELLEIQVLDDSTDETPEIAELRRPAACRARLQHPLPPPRRSTRLQGRRARSRASRKRPASFVAIFDADFVPSARLPAAHARHFSRSEGRDGAGALGPHQPGLFAADEDPVDPARRALRARARRHGTGPGASSTSTALPGVWRREAIDSAGGWQHDTLTEDLDLSYRAQLAGWRFVFLPERRLAGRSAGRDELVQVAAAPLGQGIDPDVPEADAADPALEPAGRREGGSVLPPVGELQLPADVGAVRPDVPGDVRPLQHGLVRRCC